jgi:hypothetical protein
MSIPQPIPNSPNVYTTITKVEVVDGHETELYSTRIEFQQSQLQADFASLIGAQRRSDDKPQVVVVPVDVFGPKSFDSTLKLIGSLLSKSSMKAAFTAAKKVEADKLGIVSIEDEDVIVIDEDDGGEEHGLPDPVCFLYINYSTRLLKILLLPAKCKKRTKMK